jgi:hypothetical protein
MYGFPIVNQFGMSMKYVIGVVRGGLFIISGGENLFV